MAASSTPGRTVRLVVEINRTSEGRLVGQMRTDGTDPWTPYSGVLELLKVLEEFLEPASD